MSEEEDEPEEDEEDVKEEAGADDDEPVAPKILIKSDKLKEIKPPEASANPSFKKSEPNSNTTNKTMSAIV